ncbi:hypothetical protein LIER_30527 [Lithospermum erythrorhizon]|uniref:Uncharacterized protein n=1 Tax=Lithospermum erythrorhizon TaxID=34254 RepID=A0AAV3RPV9_LITER
MDKLVNRTLGDMLRAAIDGNLKSWDQLLYKVELSYNRSWKWSTGFSHFTVIYGYNPRAPIDLALPVGRKIHDKAEDLITTLQNIHEEARKRLLVDFDVGDFVWAVLTKDRFGVGEYNKLKARKVGPYEIA